MTNQQDEPDLNLNTYIKTRDNNEKKTSNSYSLFKIGNNKKSAYYETDSDYPFSQHFTSQ